MVDRPLSPPLRQALDGLDDVAGRRAAAEAARQALHAAGLTDPATDEATRALDSGQVPPGLTSRIARLVDDLDEKYFDAQELEDQTGRKTGWEALFRKARAASATLFALENSVADTVYEASAAIEDDEKLAAAIRAATQRLH